MNLVFGIGVNDANYKVEPVNMDGSRDHCPYYLKWSNMLKRAYSEEFSQRNTSYVDSFTCSSWHSFMGFRTWMERQPWQNMQLDKDVLFQGNKEYNPDKCCFVPAKINSLLLISDKARANNMLGTSKKKGKVTNPYRAYINKGEGPHKHLGYFSTAEEAHKAWQLAKADTIDEAVLWWQFDPEVNHTFRQDAAEALWCRSLKLRLDAENGVETKSL